MIWISSISRYTKRIGITLALLFTTFASYGHSTPRIVMVVSDTTAPAYTSNGSLKVYMDNFNDQIAGFQFVLRSTRPDLLKFRFGPGLIDTAGTLVGGFQYVQAINRAGDSTEYWFRCIANDPFVPGTHPPVPIQQGGLAVRVPFRTFGLPAESLGFRCDIVFEKPTDFSDPFGTSIGAYVCPVYDTSYWRCLEYLGDSCIDWEEVTDTSEGYDYMYIDTTNLGCLDPEVVIIDDGAITLRQLTCDNNASGTVTVADLTCIVAHLFIEAFPTGCPTLNCDANGSGNLTIADLVYLVSYLFNGGPPPH